MTSLNKVELIGNIGKDAELRALQNGNAVLSFNLATSESYKKNDNWEKATEWHNVSFFGKTAENLNGKLLKGMQIYVSGKLKSSEKEVNGNNVRYWNIIANDYIILDKVQSTNIHNETTNNVQIDNEIVNDNFDNEVPF